MRFLALLLVSALGWLHFAGVPLTEAPAGPPVEIRLDGGLDPRLASRVDAIMDEYPALRRHRTTRFEILSDLDGEVVAEHAQLLERTAHAVGDFSTALGLQAGGALQAGSDRRLVIAFADRTHFIDFAATHDQVAARWLGGYFSPAGGHLVYHTVADHPGVRRLARHAESEAEAGTPPIQAAERLQDDLDRFVVRADAAVVVHEATHMLLHHAGLVVATGDQPMWLTEGIAGSFEPVEPTRKFGPLRPENNRTKEFRRMLRDDAVPPLAELVGRRDFPKTGRSQHDHYAASAALCSWLARHRPRQLQAYLLHRSDPTRGPVERATVDPVALGAPIEDVDDAWRLLEFERFFGDVATFEKTWLRSERAAASIPVATGEEPVDFLD